MKTRISILFLFITHSLMLLSGTMRVNRFHPYSDIDNTIIASVEITPKDLKENELNVYIDNQVLILHLRYIEDRGEGDFGVIFQNDSMLLSASVYHHQLSGILQGTNYVYSISKDSIGNIFMYDIDVASIPEDSSPIVSSDSNTLDERQTYSLQDTVVRVALFYTADINTSFKQNLITHVSNAILHSNVSFINSNIHAKLQLVYIGETQYISDNFDDDLERFRDKNDNYMDEIHQIREIYYADICVLLTASSEYCGLGYLKSTKNNAFCAVCASSGCFSKYSFTHEIGHNIGCHHDAYVQNNTIPTYAHGYIHLDGNNSWRTIMAYDNLCSDNSCTCRRILYWSNPEISYNGIATGNNKANNARVWNERVGTVSDFYGIPATYFMTNSLFDRADYAHIIGSDYVYTIAPCHIPNGVTVTINAEEKIVLRSGFHAKAGSKLHIKIDQPITTLSTSAAVTQHVAPPSFSAPVRNIASTDGVVTSNDNKNISSEMIQATSIYTISGQLLQTFEGNQNDISNLPNGMYILQYRMNDGGVRSEKIAITK